MSKKLDAVVIGAGASGLAAGYYLRRSGLRFKILEAAAEPGGSWPHYYESLRLFSPGRYSSLPGFPFPGEPEEYPYSCAYMLDTFACPWNPASGWSALSERAEDSRSTPRLETSSTRAVS